MVEIAQQVAETRASIAAARQQIQSQAIPQFTEAQLRASGLQNLPQRGLATAIRGEQEQALGELTQSEAMFEREVAQKAPSYANPALKQEELANVTSKLQQEQARVQSMIDNAQKNMSTAKDEQSQDHWYNEVRTLSAELSGLSQGLGGSPEEIIQNYYSGYTRALTDNLVQREQARIDHAEQTDAAQAASKSALSTLTYGLSGPQGYTPEFKSTDLGRLSSALTPSEKIAIQAYEKQHPGQVDWSNTKNVSSVLNYYGSVKDINQTVTDLKTNMPEINVPGKIEFGGFVTKGTEFGMPLYDVNKGGQFNINLNVANQGGNLSQGSTVVQSDIFAAQLAAAKLGGLTPFTTVKDGQVVTTLYPDVKNVPGYQAPAPMPDKISYMAPPEYSFHSTPSMSGGTETQQFSYQRPAAPFYTYKGSLYGDVNPPGQVIKAAGDIAFGNPFGLTYQKPLLSVVGESLSKIPPSIISSSIGPLSYLPMLSTGVLAYKAAPAIKEAVIGNPFGITYGKDPIFNRENIIGNPFGLTYQEPLLSLAGKGAVAGAQYISPFIIKGTSAVAPMLYSLSGAKGAVDFGRTVSPYVNAAQDVFWGTNLAAAQYAAPYVAKGVSAIPPMLYSLSGAKGAVDFGRTVSPYVNTAQDVFAIGTAALAKTAAPYVIKGAAAAVKATTPLAIAISEVPGDIARGTVDTLGPVVKAVAPYAKIVSGLPGDIRRGAIDTLGNIPFIRETGSVYAKAAAGAALPVIEKYLSGGAIGKTQAVADAATGKLGFEFGKELVERGLSSTWDYTSNSNFIQGPTTTIGGAEYRYIPQNFYNTESGGGAWVRVPTPEERAIQKELYYQQAKYGVELTTKSAMLGGAVALSGGTAAAAFGWGGAALLSPTLTPARSYLQTKGPFGVVAGGIIPTTPEEVAAFWGIGKVLSIGTAAKSTLAAQRLGAGIKAVASPALIGKGTYDVITGDSAEKRIGGVLEIAGGLGIGAGLYRQATRNRIVVTKTLKGVAGTKIENELMLREFVKSGGRIMPGTKVSIVSPWREMIKVPYGGGRIQRSLALKTPSPIVWESGASKFGSYVDTAKPSPSVYNNLVKTYGKKSVDKLLASAKEPITVLPSSDTSGYSRGAAGSRITLTKKIGIESAPISEGMTMTSTPKGVASLTGKRTSALKVEVVPGFKSSAKSSPTVKPKTSSETNLEAFRDYLRYKEVGMKQPERDLTIDVIRTPRIPNYYEYSRLPKGLAGEKIVLGPQTINEVAFKINKQDIRVFKDTTIKNGVLVEKTNTVTVYVGNPKGSGGTFFRFSPSSKPGFIKVIETPIKVESTSVKSGLKIDTMGLIDDMKTRTDITSGAKYGTSSTYLARKSPDVIIDTAFGKKLPFKDVKYIAQQLDIIKVRSLEPSETILATGSKVVGVGSETKVGVVKSLKINSKQISMGTITKLEEAAKKVSKPTRLGDMVSSSNIKEVVFTKQERAQAVALIKDLISKDFSRLGKDNPIVQIGIRYGHNAVDKSSNSELLDIFRQIKSGTPPAKAVSAVTKTSVEVPFVPQPPSMVEMGGTGTSSYGVSDIFRGTNQRFADLELGGGPILKPSSLQSNIQLLPPPVKIAMGRQVQVGATKLGALEQVGTLAGTLALESQMYQQQTQLRLEQQPKLDLQSQLKLELQPQLQQPQLQQQIIQQQNIQQPQLQQPQITQIQVPDLRFVQIQLPQTITPPEGRLGGGVLTTIPQEPPKRPKIVFVNDDILKQPIKKKEKKKASPQGYEVLIRRKGKFRLATSFAVPKEEAIAIGATKVLKTAAATFKIIPSKRRVVSTGARISPSQFAAAFRPTKKKEPFTFTQRKTVRIKSMGEKLEISAAGAQARRKIKFI